MGARIGFFGGVTQTVLPDNMKKVILDGVDGQPRFHPMWGGASWKKDSVLPLTATRNFIGEPQEPSRWAATASSPMTNKGHCGHCVVSESRANYRVV